MRNIDRVNALAKSITFLCARHKLVVAVEGNDDVRVYGRKFHDDVHCVSCSGKPNILNIIDILIREDRVQNYVGVIDSDYDHFTGDQRPCIQTDYVDLESYAIWLAIDCVLAQLDQYLDPEKMFSKNLTTNDIFEIAILRATDLGAIRCHNDVNKLGISISNTGKKGTNNFKRIENIDTLDVHEGLLGVIERIKQLNEQVRFPPNYTEDVIKLRETSTPEKLIKGGDVIEAFVEISTSVKVLEGSCDIKAVLKSLLGCITPTVLCNTNLVREIRKIKLAQIIQS